MEFIKSSIHDKTPETIALVEDLPSLEKEIGDFKSSQVEWNAKIEAAAIAKAANIETWVVV
jgi:glutamate 5-kinase